MNDARLLLDTLRLGGGHDAVALAERWSRADGIALVRVAEYEGAALWLPRRLAALGITLDTPSRERLTALTTRGLAQCLRVDAETIASLSALQAAGVRAVPLKSAALRRLAGRVPYADARVPVDVDLLVPNADALHAWACLRERGYTQTDSAGPHDGHQLPNLVGPIGVAVELHRTTIASVPPDEAWHRATGDGASATFAGIERTVPGDTELLWHALAHSIGDVGESARTGLRLRYWLDAAALLAANADIDWARMRSRIESPECERPALARAWMLAAAGLAGVTLPGEALGAGPVRALDLERMIAWRLRVFARHGADSRWSRRLLEEGTRGEASLPVQPWSATARSVERLRHAVAARAARAWWLARR